MAEPSKPPVTGHDLFEKTGQIPVRCRAGNSVKSTRKLPREKFLVLPHFTVGNFILILRRNLVLTARSGLFILCNGQLLASSTQLGDLYRAEKNSDGYLELVYIEENTFG